MFCNVYYCKTNIHRSTSIITQHYTTYHIKINIINLPSYKKGIQRQIRLVKKSNNHSHIRLQ